MSTTKKTLGLVELPDKTVEHDFTMLEHFQSFSSELLRLALLGITAIGFGVSKIIFPEADGSSIIIKTETKILIGLALASFCFSAAGALLHRYASSNSMSWHLQAMRRYANGVEAQVAKADAERNVRYRNFQLSKFALASSAISLTLGAVLLSVAVGFLLIR